MPHVTHDRNKPAATPAGEASLPRSRPAGGVDSPAERPGRKGALFRALVNAGCDLDAAYNAEAEVESMVAENLVAQFGAQMQVGFMEIKQHFRETSARFAEQGQRLDEHSRKLDALTEQVRRLEVLPARLDAMKTELRLVWGALGVLVTVLLAVFGLLFTAGPGGSSWAR